MTYPLIDQPRRLPVTIPLVRDETIHSYLHRLAGANHLRATDLASYLDAPARTSGPHRFDRLAAMTGHPADRLRDMLAPAIHPRHQREACRRCTAQRGIRTSVHLAAPTYRPTCHRHRRWLPDDYHPDQQQYDLRDLPEVLIAQRHHIRLVREHGVDQAAGLVNHAGYITQRWTYRGDWAQHRDRRLRRFLDPDRWWISAAQPLITMVNYPETIALARLLANPRWTQQAISDDPAANASFYAEVSRRLNITYEPHTTHDPLLGWQQHARAARRYPEIVQLQ
jgi:hypothetical protein